MPIIINSAQLKIIYDHAETIYPEECCGILLGKMSETTKVVTEVIPTINAWEKAEYQTARTKHSRYTIPPRDILRAQQRGRDLQLEIIGFFHSHPDCLAIPSTCDREQAWEVYSYPIVSAIEGKVTDFQSWVLDVDGIFQPEQVQLMESGVRSQESGVRSEKCTKQGFPTGEQLFKAGAVKPFCLVKSKI